jgi:hypothetical protein
MHSACQDDIRLAELFSSIVKEESKIKHGGYVDEKYLNKKRSEYKELSQNWGG